MKAFSECGGKERKAKQQIKSTSVNENVTMTHKS